MGNGMRINTMNDYETDDKQTNTVPVPATLEELEVLLDLGIIDRHGELLT